MRELTPNAGSQHPSSTTVVTLSLENEKLLPGSGTGVYKSHLHFNLAFFHQEVSNRSAKEMPAVLALPIWKLGRREVKVN